MSDESGASQKGDGFLSRWSAKKRKDVALKQAEPVNEEAVGSGSELQFDIEQGPNVQEGYGLATIAAPTDAKSEDTLSVNSQNADPQNQLAVAEEQEEPLLCDDDMPSLDTLTDKSDLSDFFNKGVSATLRRAALRHVFSLPVYNIRDGLNDYDEDYTYFEPLGDTVTSDMKWHKARKERAAAEEEERLRLANEEASEEANEDANKELESEAAENEQEVVAKDDESAPQEELETTEELAAADTDEVYALSDSANEHDIEGLAIEMSADDIPAIEMPAIELSSIASAGDALPLANKHTKKPLLESESTNDSKEIESEELSKPETPA